jgi:tRNA (mo5U34)-methyltransferase
VTPDELKQAVAGINWWHRIDLGQGVVTPGHDDSPAKLGAIRMPADLHGKSVLDLGASDGFFSFEAERRGAARVVAADPYYKNWPGGWGGHGTRAGFDFAREVLASRAEMRDLDCMDLSPETAGGTFDLVLFLGVLYHLKHPLLGLEHVASVTAGQLILETHADFMEMSEPLMAYYPDRELNNDPTNWWGPNPAAVEAMLRTVGFRRVETVHRYEDQPRRRSRQTGRVVVHAWK